MVLARASRRRNWPFKRRAHALGRALQLGQQIGHGVAGRQGQVLLVEADGDVGKGVHVVALQGSSWAASEARPHCSKQLLNQGGGQQPAVAVEAVQAQQAGLSQAQRAVVGQGGAQIDIEPCDARLGQRGHDAVGGGHQLDGALQADGRAVLALDLAGAEQQAIRRARHEIDAMARMQQAQRPLQAVAAEAQVHDLAAHAAQARGLRPGAQAAAVDGPVRGDALAGVQTNFAGMHGLHRRLPMPAHAGGLIVERSHHPRRVDQAFAGQQPGARPAQKAGLQVLQLGLAQGLRPAEFGVLTQAGQHPLGRTQVLAVREQQAALGLQARPDPQRFTDLGPELQRAPAQGGHLGLGPVQLGQGAEHAGGGEGGRALAVEARFGAGAGLEDLHGVAGAAQRPGEQAPGQARARDGDLQAHLRPAGWGCRSRCPAP